MFPRMKQLGMTLIVLGSFCASYADGNPTNNGSQYATSRHTSAAPTSGSDAENMAMLNRGRLVWMRCRTCHEAPSVVGPRLGGLFGTTAGSRPGYAYSNALRSSGIVWDARTLDQFIKHPADVVPGTRMEFPGIANESDRNALIRYLETKFNAK